jgi:hypothetical protein
MNENLSQEDIGDINFLKLIKKAAENEEGKQ